jgi:O-antigen ligase
VVHILNFKLLFVAILFILFIFYYYKSAKINKYKLISIILIISIIISIVGFAFVLNTIVPNNLGMLSARGYVWNYTYQMLKENFIIGYGPDTFYYNFPQRNPDTEVYSKNIVFDKPHNMYLQIFVDNGIFGIIGFIILLASILLTTLKTTYMDDKTNAVIFSKGIFFTTIAYMIQGITNDNHMVIQPLLYLLIGSAIAISRKIDFIKR